MSSSKASSPAANLIRNSRLVAMPIPRGASLSDSQAYRPPYPTHQAITTPDSSRSRGDWGLKRPIPRKVHSKYLRYNSIDSIEHRTTFQSSHDTVTTLKKWQEMDIPIKLYSQLANRFTSAFYFDTLPSPSSSEDPHQEILAAPKSYTLDPPVWGYRTKFIQRMTPGELKTFIDKKIVPRRREFELFVKDGASSRSLPQQQQSPLLPEHSNLDADVDATAPASPPQHLQPKEEQERGHSQNQHPLSPITTLPNFAVRPVDTLLKSIRHDDLKSLNDVREFLRMPLRDAPMTLHPSAGLYYILDASYLENHPQYGPNPSRIIPARVIHKFDMRMTDNSYRRREFYIIGGIVQFSSQDIVTQAGLETYYKITRVTGIAPEAADLDQHGRIRLELDHIGPHQPLRDLIEGTSTSTERRAQEASGHLKATKSAVGRHAEHEQPHIGPLSSDPLPSDLNSKSRRPSRLLTDLLTHLNVSQIKS
ncbi:hypothetical protein DRE_03320 [Drechslerella stenobrocha 248]|uniref:Uncharacterized protein n=1 Tax=Drechslerella stenobrocha 248 TaxID=1043628 RepID=W7HSY2_9PEZI|nr:hypothetical protein DRE_03320 [Drechslerella stenobrocha 248]